MKGNTSRALGAYEKLFWVLDQMKQVHFVMAFEISGAIRSEALQNALNAVQDRHPLLSVRINGDNYKYPVFEKVQGVKIPLRVVPKGNGSQLDTEMSEELHQPFDGAAPPLMRAVLIEDEHKPTIILSIHHSISDGISLLYVVRDLMLLLNGKTLVPRSMPASIDDILRLSADPGTIAPVTESNYIPVRDNQEKPYVETLKFSAALTSRLLQRCRDHGTTMQGALFAAFVLAARKASPQWREKNIDVRNPVSVRLPLEAEEDCCVYITSKMIASEAGDQRTFWELAQYAGKELHNVKTYPTVKESISMMRSKAFADIDFQTLSKGVLASTSFAIMLSNLGRLPYHPTIGDHTIETVWGPLSLASSTEQQSIGVATRNGELAMAYASREAIGGYLAAVWREVERECE